MQKNTKKMTRFTMTAMFMALVIVLSSFGIPVPGGHLYLNDPVIVTGALLLDPVASMLAGGLGAFLGDAIFYPTPMFVSLVTHGLQAYVISKMAHTKDGQRKSTKQAIAAVCTGAVIMVVGYSLGRAFIYATKEAAMLKLPFQILQAALGCIIGVTLVYHTPLAKYFDRRM